VSEQEKTHSINETILLKNRQWTCELEKGIAKLPGELQQQVMQGPGKDCAQVILKLCTKYLGHATKGIEDLLDGYNLMRENLGLHGGKWRMEGGEAVGVFSECGCPMIRTGLLDLHPTRCLCTHAMLENLFQEVTGGTAQVEIVQSIGRGDKVCRFEVKAEDVSGKS
jgi:predicted hydrocarbon binding protein